MLGIHIHCIHALVAHHHHLAGISGPFQIHSVVGEEVFFHQLVRGLIDLAFLVRVAV